MSTHANIITEIFDLIELKNTLSGLELQYQEMQSMTTEQGAIQKVDVVIKDPHGRAIGLKKTKQGKYEFIADCQGLTDQQRTQQKKFINTIKQKYAYNKVLSQLKQQGYIIAQEEKVQNNTIRVVARKWQ